MPFACDYKRIGDGDEGPNTGGMGAYSPPPWLDEALEPVIHETITEAAVAAMMEEGAPYRGVLYPGLMVTKDGPKAIEFNCRFGDPDTQPLLPRLENDLLPILLGDAKPEVSSRAAVTVVLAGGKYPAAGDRGTPISGVEDAEATGALVFHAGTALHDGQLVTNGGRVLNVVGVGDTVAAARTAAYEAVACIDFAGMQFRTDIAADG
jgi:phosphoribosylamine--glycine ligase